MNVIATRIPEVKLLEPKLYGDQRGFFMETWRESAFNELLGTPVHFVQDNHSASTKGVLRGLHYQIRQPQGKLVRVIAGEVYDVAVDLRRSSATFGHYSGHILSQANRHMLWVPPGFAHGFLVLSERAEFVYKCSDYYAPEYERSLRWDDPEIGIEWPFSSDMTVQLSAKDEAGLSLSQAEHYE